MDILVDAEGPLSADTERKNSKLHAVCIEIFI